MLLDVSAVIAGFALLIWGADQFIIGAASVARNLGVSPLLIGLTMVGLGTSSPEILVAGVAAYQGNPDLAIGNAIGSNIANIALILGVTALIVPLDVRSDTLQREYPVLLAISLLALTLMYDGSLTRMDGLILLAGLIVMLIWMVRLGVSTRSGDPLQSEYEAEIPSHISTRNAMLRFFVGLIALLVASRMLVWGAINIAHSFGVSDLVIGLTIVAIGTSLPELAASLTSALKGEHDIAIGNIIGSNMFNLLAVLSVPALIIPGAFAPEALSRDMPVMIGLTLAMFAMGYGFGGPGKINRFEGLLLVSVFIGYQLLLFFGADALTIIWKD